MKNEMSQAHKVHFSKLQLIPQSRVTGESFSGEMGNELDKVLEIDPKEYADKYKSDGDKFEKFIVRKFNTKGKQYNLREWTGDKYVDGIYPKSNTDPDLKLALVGSGVEWLFAVECKWRKGSFNDSVELAKPEQLVRYKNYEKRTGEKTFIVLGIGGTSDNPDHLFVIPVEELTEINLTKQQLVPYHQKGKGNFHYDHKTKHLTISS